MEKDVKITLTGVAIVGIVAFVISYSALQSVAAANGFAGYLSYGWPLLIDLPIIVFAYSSLTIQRLTGKRAYFATTMIILFSIATVIFNLIHAVPTITGYMVAVVPPVALIVSFEAVRELIAIVTVNRIFEPVITPIATPTPTVTLITSEPKPVDTESSDKEVVKQVVKQIVNEFGKVSYRNGAEKAKEIYGVEMSHTKFGEILKSLNGAV